MRRVSLAVCVGLWLTVCVPVSAGEKGEDEAAEKKADKAKDAKARDAKSRDAKSRDAKAKDAEAKDAEAKDAKGEGKPDAPALIPLEQIPPNEPGSLRFDVKCRGFSVEINGEKRGLGPGGILDGVPPGEYEVRIACPGHNAWSDEVHVKPGDIAKVKPRLKPVAGFLEVDCKLDGAEVFLGEDRIGETPMLEPIVVRPGVQEVKVSKPGYPPFTAKVRVAVGKTRKVTVKMSAVTGRLVVKSKPRMALVSVDEEPVGETPVSVALPVGSHQVRVSLDGHEPRVAVIEVRKGEATPLEVVLPRSAVVASRTEPEAAGGLDPAPPPGKGDGGADGKPLYRQWWLWTGVAAVVVAAVVIPVAVTQSGGDGGGPGDASLGSRTLHLLDF